MSAEPRDTSVSSTCPTLRARRRSIFCACLVRKDRWTIVWAIEEKGIDSIIFRHDCLVWMCMLPHGTMIKKVCPLGQGFPTPHPSNMLINFILLFPLKTGAVVYPVPAVAFDNPENYNHQAARHAQRLENAVWTNQFDNTANRRAHIETTGPEIWKQLDGHVDGFTCSTGTGGTLAGIARYLKEKSNGKTKIFLADPPGSVLYSYIKSGGTLIERGGSSITEGIGQGRVTENLKPDIELIDDALQIPDADSLKMLYRLLDEEGIYVGASSALNVVAAVEMAKKLGPNKNIVTILCDGAYRYQSRLFSKKWIESKGLTDAIPEHLKKYATLD